MSLIWSYLVEIVVCSYLVNFNSIHQLLTYDMHVHTLCIRSFMMLRAMHFLSNLKVVSKYVIQAAATIGNNIQSQLNSSIFFFAVSDRWIGQ